MKKFLLSAAFIAAFFTAVFAQAPQPNPLRTQIEQLTKPIKGIVGVSIISIEGRDTLNYNGKARLVMQSVMKFPIALTVLHWVDSGKMTLDETVKVGKRDLKNTNSSLHDKYPGGGEITISELLGYMVSQSDNNACDILFNQVGGPKTVQDYMLRLGVKGIAVRATEADMASSWELQYTNWVKPEEMTKLLDQFYQGKILSKTGTDFLYKLMTDATTAPKRLKGLLPAGTVVAHKSGTSGTNDAKLTPATNDVGIITLPNGKHIAISALVCNSTDDEATREGVIANIAKAAFDYYNH
jgi:beta-lactamase class A